MKRLLLLIACNILIVRLTDAGTGYKYCKQKINGIKVKDYITQKENLTKTIPIAGAKHVINCILAQESNGHIVTFFKAALGQQMGLQIQDKANNLNVANILYTLSDPSSQNFTRNDKEKKWLNKQMLKFRHKSTVIANQLRNTKNLLLEDEHIALLCQGLDLVETKSIPFRAFWGIKESILNSFNNKIKIDNNKLSDSAPKKPFLSNLIIQDMFINNALVPEAKDAIIDHLRTYNAVLTEKDRLDEERKQVTQAIKAQSEMAAGA